MSKENDKQFVTEITPQGEDFSRWYIDVIKKADLMDYAPVRGCIVFKPDGFEIWEHIKDELDRRFGKRAIAMRTSRCSFLRASFKRKKSTWKVLTLNYHGLLKLAERSWKNVWQSVLHPKRLSVTCIPSGFSLIGIFRY